MRALSRLARAVGACIVVVMIAGSECGAPAPVPVVPDQVESWNPGTTGPGGAAGGNADAATDEHAQVGYSSLLLDGVASGVGGDFDIYDAAGRELLSGGHAPEQPVAVAPGTYVLTQAGNPAFVFASAVAVEADRLTVVAVGAIRLVLVEGATRGWFDLYDASGRAVLSQANEPDLPVTAPAGTYVLKQSFNEAFTFAESVAVQAGATTTVRLGAVRLETVAGAAGGQFDIYGPDGTVLLAEANEPDVPVAVPPGTYVLKRYFNDRLVLAAGVTVAAGQSTVIRMGALRYNGAVAYDLYLGNNLVVPSCLPGELQTIPPGTYSLYEYFSDRLLASGVVVQPGQITEVE
ncbi:MAG: hypothetical protein HRF43_03005 [Phycisphaerae bacterium]|jgi:hypothetical protein